MGLRRQKSFDQQTDNGTLYLVGTPIGNLNDMTVRAVDTLRQVTVIAAEDTRQTRKLTNHFQIETPLVSYHEHNRGKRGPELLDRLRRGDSVALVSDAGLPAVADPGAELVSLAIEADCPVIPIPGANAALSALIASGLPTERFVFLGFLPRDRQSLRNTLAAWEKVKATVLLYEAPHRLLKTLRLIREMWGNRRVAIARELTKRYEEWLRGSVDELIRHFEQAHPRGEFTLIIEPFSGDVPDKAVLPWWHSLTLTEHVEHYTTQGESTRDAIKRVASDRAVNKRDVYNRYHQ